MVSPGELESGEEASVSRRGLILRDSLTFLSLTLVTIALFTVTLLLFRSFAAHRTELGRRWSDRGRAALDRGHPEQAIEPFRTALSYAPGEHGYELLLAQALAAAGHTEEAYNYFSGLWDAEPGSGPINLQLARLAAAKKEQQAAVNFYRASIFGTWDGDGVVRRRSVRLELANYLLEHHDLSGARVELLVAEGNAEHDAALDLELGHRFEEAGDQTDALEAYQKASDADPRDAAPLEAAGRLAFRMGDFANAQRLLRRAVRVEDGEAKSGKQARESVELLRKADRILELVPSRRLSVEERVTRLLELRTIAQRRLDACEAQPSGATAELQEINDRWTAMMKGTTRGALLRDAGRQDELLRLVFETEAATEAKATEVCGAATGDDALLLLLARDPNAVERE